MPLAVTATLGVPGSASTWVFNVVRELQMIQFGPKRVHSFFNRSVEKIWDFLIQHPHADVALVWKLHEANRFWSQFLIENKIGLLLSVRDPRDAMLSLMERFGESYDGALHRVSDSMQSITNAVNYEHMWLRYEDRFFDRTETVAAIAEYLGVVMPEGEQERIFSTYQTIAIRSFAEHIENLLPSRLKGDEATRYDETTQIHRTHIGDQKIGKWRDRFSMDERHRLTSHFEPFLSSMGYDLD